MPPALFITKVAATAPSSTTWQIALPAAAKPGDTVLLVVGCDTGQTGLNAASSPGWESIGNTAIVGSRAILLRYELTGAEGPTITATMTGARTWGFGAALVYRALAKGEPIVGQSSTTITSSTNFSCPGIALVRYSDMFLGVVVVTSAATAVTPPAAGTERDEQQSGGRTMEVFEVLKEAPGGTGTQTATTGANQSGLAASFAIVAGPLLASDKVIAFEPSGAIGLPTEGV